jgi:CBS domain containing-hemolysin-like protein
MTEAAFTLLGMLLLLALQGFFSGSEIALVNADKVKLRHLARKGNRGAQLVLDQFERPERLLATTLVGTNIATVSLATLGTVSFIRLLGSGADVLAFLVITPVMLIFGEVVPKSVYQQKADTLAPVIIYPLRVFSWLLFPVILLFSAFARGVSRLVYGGEGGKTVFVAREKIRALLELAEQTPSDGVFDHQRLRRALRFSDITAGEAMVPLTDAVVIDASRDLASAIQRVRSSGYRRLPVIDPEAGRVTGVLMLTTWDLLDRELDTRPVEDFVHPPVFVAPGQLVEEVLPLLQDRPEEMAIVVDEYGSAVGLITVEDILEEVVGSIEDPEFQMRAHHRHVARRLEGGAWEADGLQPIADLNEQLDIDLPTREYHTVGGLLVARLQHIPRPGESVVEAGLRFTAMEVDERMALKVRIEPVDGGGP